MKKRLLGTLALTFASLWPMLFAFVGNPPQSPPTGTLPLLWDYPDAMVSTSLAFRVYSTTNVALPLTNWSLVATVTNQTWANVVTNTDRAFYYVTAFDGFGESVPSNVGAWPQHAPTNLRMR